MGGTAGRRRLLTIIGVLVVLGVVLAGAGAWAVSRIAAVVRDGVSPGACHEDPDTVAALRASPLLTRDPPGAAPGEVQERIACGSEERGELTRVLVRSGPVADLRSFYADLGRADGWQDSGAGLLSKDDGRGCRWTAQLRSIDRDRHQLTVSYVPGDLCT